MFFFIAHERWLEPVVMRTFFLLQTIEEESEGYEECDVVMNDGECEELDIQRFSHHNNIIPDHFKRTIN